METPSIENSGRQGHASWRRYLPIALAGVAGVAISVTLYAAAKKGDQERLEREFIQAAGDLGTAWLRMMTARLEALEAIRNFHNGSQSVEADEFARFTENTFKAHPGLKVLAWVPRVTATEYSEHVASAETKYKLPPGYQVRFPEGRTQAYDSVARPPVCFPIQYVEPFATSRESLWGLDLSRHAECAAAMAAAEAHGSPIATGPIQLGQGAQGGV